MGLMESAHGLGTGGASCRCWLPLLLLAARLLLAGEQCSALDNGVAQTPPMGWNSWGHFKSGVSAELLGEVADALVSLGLRDAGYVYVNTDDGWLETNRTETGKLQPAPHLFPSGEASIVNLTRYIHGLQLKFGIYSSNSLTTCMSKAGGLYNERLDAASYAEWGVDFLKYDLCGQGNLQAFVTFQVMRDALNLTNRPMLYSCEPQQLRGDPIEWPPYIANMFRIAADMGGYYGLFTGDALLSNAWVNVAQRGGWTDAGYLEIGNVPNMVNVSMSRTQFALWCIIKTNLLIAADIRQMNESDPYLQILLNKEMIEISQDPLAHIGRLVAVQAVGDPTSASPSIPQDVDVSESQRGHTGVISISAEIPPVWQGTASGVAVTDCVLNPNAVTRAQQWSLTGPSKDTITNVGECLTLAGNSVKLEPCDGSERQRWASSRNNESASPLSEIAATIAPIVKVNATITVNDTIVPLCLTTNGSSLLVEGCVYDPPWCNATRCSKRIQNSPRWRQLWYLGKTGQLMSTYTGGGTATITSAAALRTPSPPPSFDGPLPGLPLPDLTNRRCGDGHNGMKDQSSPLCTGASNDGRLVLSLVEMSRRCEADTHCAGFGEYGTGSSSYFRPVFKITSVNAAKQYWKLWRKRHYMPPPVPPPSPTPPGPAPAPSPAPALRNVPVCLATAANRNPPLPPVPPSLGSQQAGSHQLQIWAAKMSRGRRAVVLVNAFNFQNRDKPGWFWGAANVTARWSDLWLNDTTTVRVRDAVNHCDIGSATQSVTVEVAVHDVAVLVLTPVNAV